MHVDFASITAYQRYKLMASLIVPRPIALVTTINADGVVNAAPFSMFNMLGEEPPLVMISINLLASGGLKDTAANIVESGQFVVHLADEAIAAKMHACGEALPAHQSELDKVGLTTAPSVEIAPPRIAEAPVAFECALWETIRTDSRLIFFGKVLHLHAREGLIDTKAWRVSLQDYFPVGRFGASFYVTTRDRFSLEDEAGKVRETEIDRI
ncbi:flavin reductase domain-containing protein [Caulobacter vibrioides]|jgi:flavin reductase (DIM6/NTAB) family NADH-FMN oxidoreductase RutF|uniref:Flavin reductase family protein n=1 Tax=Caulobacter radicis TaxID=2172650 RepID=A0A2T9JQI6_9CAUL|nr:flavin reductase family protein [Caulobacter radicis]KSB91879.1 flavin reductase domain-containing protein [Caulobacter vibrioides]PVM85980.1 flavin reductase family protein [Caulobacter radicis]